MLLDCFECLTRENDDNNDLDDNDIIIFRKNGKIIHTGMPKTFC